MMLQERRGRRWQEPSSVLLVLGEGGATGYKSPTRRQAWLSVKANPGLRTPGALHLMGEADKQPGT